MRNDGDTFEAHDPARLDAADAPARQARQARQVKPASAASLPRRAHVGPAKRKTIGTTGSRAVLSERAAKAPKAKALSTRKAPRSRNARDTSDGCATGEDADAMESPAAHSVPSSQLAFAERPTPTEPGATDAESDAARELSQRVDPRVEQGVEHLELDEHAEVFFKAAEPSAASDHAQSAESLAPVEQDREPDARELARHVHLRRAQLAKYVRAAVAVSAALCLAAVVRGAVARVTHEHEATAHARTSDPNRAVVAHQAPHDFEATLAASPAAVVPAQVGPEAAAIAASPAPAVEAVPAKSAAEEKRSTRIALERGKLQDAIAAGERAIALDPTDGEAWLLLGAAYQDSGKASEARRCFAACAKEGKRGAINECRMMLR
jgi:tetratricopeptide (TPR) repeat protein